MTWNIFPLQLRRRRHITPTVLELAFRRTDGRPLAHDAGQFINVHFEANGEPVHRSYSIATPPGRDVIEIAISPVKGGLATELLFGLKEGDPIQASGPYGRFVLRDDPPCRYVLAGTGTGITPFRAMLPELERRVRERQFQVDLLLGVWSREELLYGQDFIDASSRQAGFRFHACYSRAFPQDPQPWERRGYVQSQFDALRLDPATDVMYLCGNPNMIDQAMERLRAAAFPSRNLRREKYLPARAAGAAAPD